MKWVCILALSLVCRPAPAGDVSVTATRMAELPLNGRNYLDLLPGVSEVTRGQEGGNLEGFGPYSPRGNSALNSLGQRGQNNNFLLDGMDNNESWLRGAVLEPSLESIETVSLVATKVPASLGHAAGAAVNVQTRSGSNQVHGSLFEYFQDSVFNTRNFFDGARKPGLTQNQFGGSIGGAARKNDWFVFFGPELSRERRGLTGISTLPTAVQKSGDFGATRIYDPVTISQQPSGDFARQPFAGNRIPSSRIPVQARNLIALYPDPNLPGLFNNYRFTPALDRDGERLNFRSDKKLSDRGTLVARLTYERRNRQSHGSLPGTVGSFVESDVLQYADGTGTSLAAWGAAVAHTYTLRPSLINEVRAGMTRFDLHGHALDRGLDSSALLSIPGLGMDGLPSVRPTGYAQLGATGPAPFGIRTTSYEVDDTLSWTLGGHAMKFGMQVIRRHADGDASDWTGRGTFLFTPDYTSQVGVDGTGDAIASLLAGYPSEVRRDIQYSPFRLRGWEPAGYAQDDIRIGRRLTIQAGVRYSAYPPVTEAEDRMVNFNFSREAPALDQFAGQNGVNQYAGPVNRRRALAPRIGFALDLFGRGGTVLRGAFSQLFDTGSYIAEGILARNPPYAARQDIFAGSLQLGLALADGLPAPQRGPLLDAAGLNRVHGSIYAIEPAEYTPYSDQWGLCLQQRLRTGLTLEIAGMGSMGMHLHSMLDYNQPYPAPSPFPYRRYPYEPYVSRVEYLGFSGGSTYYGGQLRLAGELRPGLRLDAAYRYAKSLDDATAPGSGQQSRPSNPQYIYNGRLVRSISPFDVSQRVTLTASWGRAGWRASAAAVVQSGFPFTPELAVNGLNDGGIWLPNRVGDGALPQDQRSYLHWFNTSLDRSDPSHAFETPALYQYGNSGYDIVRGPGLATVDAALGRSFALGNGLRLEARVEAFNLLNRTNFALPNRILGLASSGAINHTSTPSRQLQLVFRLEW
jgi:hypothetical protein